MGFFVEAKNGCGQWIAMMMVVEELAVKAGLAYRRLNCLEIHAVILRYGITRT